MQATGSIVNNAHLIKKVYFPPEVLPISVVLVQSGQFPDRPAALLRPGAPVRRAPHLGGPAPASHDADPDRLHLGVSFLLATLNVFFRDTQVILGVIMLAWFFLTPVFYTIKPCQSRPRSWA